METERIELEVNGVTVNVITVLKCCVAESLKAFYDKYGENGQAYILREADFSKL